MSLTASWMTPFTLVAAVGLALPISAQPVPGPSPARASAPQRASVIDLRSGAIDTSSGFVGWAAVTGPGQAGRWVIQLDGPMTPERRGAMAAAGVVLGEYLPAFAYVAHVDGADAGAAGGLTFVRWAAPYRDGWKLDPELGLRPAVTAERAALVRAGRDAVVVTLFRDADLEEARRDILTLPGARVYWARPIGRSWTLGVELASGDAARLAAIADIMYVEPAPEVTPRNSTTRWIVQSNIPDFTPLYDRGLHGEGQVVGVLDEKLDVNHCSFEDDQPIGPEHRKVLAYNTQQGVGVHGTHVCGIAVGDAGLFAETRGVAYLGRLVFDDIPNFGEGPVYAALETHHVQGGRVHTNSWGNDGTKSYDSLCRGFDAFQYDFEDSLVVLAVTNAGDLRNPENAKNLLAVGGSFDAPNQAAHCTGGVGPTTDGRRKPEIYAPGCDILSSSAGTQCGVTSLSGTSMAAPAVAGTGLLVRQYFTEGYYPTGAPQPGNELTPTGALLKAALLNSAADMTGVPGYPTNLEGWGRVLADDALYFSGESRRLIVSDVRNDQGLSTGQSAEIPVAVTGSQESLRITVAWTEPPASAGANFASINDLDLEVSAPDGTTYKGNVFGGGFSTPGGTKDDRNNVEQVHIAAPTPGQWTVRIVGAGINEGLQGYAAVITGEVDSGPAGLTIGLAGPLPDFVDPGTSLEVLAMIDPGDDELVPGSPTLHYRLSDGSFLTTPLVQQGDGVFGASLPSVDCVDEPEFYLSAEGVIGGQRTSPFNAPDSMFSFTVGGLETTAVAAYAFESGLPNGWMQSGLWHSSSSCKPGGSCDGGSYLYYGSDNGCTYDTGGTNSGSVTSAPIALPDVPPGGSVMLTYCSALQTENLGGYDTATLSVNGTPVDAPSESIAWEERAVDLTAWAGQSVTLRWMFDSVDDQFNFYRGWHIDGVEIAATILVCDPVSCYPDCDANGDLDLFDFLCFQNDFVGGEPGADCDQNQGLDLFDFLCFQNAFVGGC